MSNQTKNIRISRPLSARLLICALAFAGLAGVSSAAAQTFAPTRFPPQGAQYVEGSPMTQNWLFTGGNWGDGDQNGVNAVFFEIPDTTTQTLYFAVRNPDIDTINNSTGNPDNFTIGAASLVNYTLIGGTGAYSKAAGRHLSHTTSAATDGGTQLDSIIGGTYSAAFRDSTWVYFNGVSPSQGEHIGNKFYFRLTAAAPNFNAANATPPGFKHSYQFDVSLTNSGTPTGLSSAYAFSYDVTFTQLYTNPPAVTETWDFWPFVPFGAGTPMSFTTGSFDYAGTNNQIQLNTWVDNLLVSQGAIPQTSANYQTLTYPVSAAQSNAGWHLNFTVKSNFGYTAGGGELYFSIGGSLLRIYATNPPVVTADHFTLSPATSSGITGSNLAYRAQLVDASGNPISYIATVKVATSSGTTTLGGLTAAPNTTTDTTGGANFTVSDTAQETVNLSLTSNGTGGTTSLPGTNGTATAIFTNNPDPTLSSATNCTGTVGIPLKLPIISISANGGTKVTIANGIKIRPNPADIGIIASFNSSLTALSTSLTNGGSSAVGVMSYSGGVLTIPVTGADWGTTTKLTIGLATPTATSNLSFTAPTGEGSGSLQLSVDGGTTWITDDKIITIVDPNPTYTWSAGGGSGVWTLGANWAGGTAPSLNNGTENIIIPNGCSNYPTLPAAWSIKNLSIDTAASLTLGGYNFTVTGTWTNNGKVYLQGSETVSYASLVNGSSCTVIYNGTTDLSTTPGILAFGNSYANLTFNGVGGKWKLGGTLSVGGALTITAGTLLANGQTMTTGSFSNSGTLVLNGNESINGGAGFTSAGAAQYVGTGDYTGTGLAAGSSYGTLSFSGSSGGKWKLGADVTASVITVAASNSLDLGIYNVVTAAITNNGTLRLGGGTQSIAGGVTNNSGSTVVYYGAGASALAAGYSYANLTVSGTGSYTLGSALTVSGVLTVSGGGLGASSAGSITAGDIDLSSGPLISIDAGASALSVDATSNTNIYLGAAAGAGLNLSNAELVKIRAAGLTIAASGTGTITATSVDTTGATHGTLTLSNFAALSLSGATNTFVAGFSASTTLAAGISLGSSTEVVANSVTLGKLAMGASNLTLSCDDLTLGGGASSVSGTGALVTRTRTLNRSITVNGTVGGTLSLTPTDFLALGGWSFSSFTIGQTTGTGVISVAAALGPALFPSIDFIASNATANLIQVNNSLQNSSAGTISFDGQAQLGNGVTVFSTGGNINFNYPVTLADGATATVSTSGTGVIAFAAGATIDGNSGAGLENLSLTTAGTAISFGGAIGGSQPLNNVSVSVNVGGGGGAAQALPATTIGGTLSVTSNGAITQGGAIKGSALVAKTLNNAGAPITLTTATNDFATIDLRARNLADGANAAGAIAYTDANNVSVTALQTASTANLIATAGALSQTGVIACTTLTTTSTTGTALGAANTVSAFTASNTVSGNISLTNAIVTLTIPAGGVTEVAGGTVTIANTGAITLSGPVGAGNAGTISLDTGGASAITGSGLLTADTIKLQTGTGSFGTVGVSAASPINTAVGTGPTALSLGQGTSLAGAFISHTGALNLGAPSLAANAPLSVVASGLLTLPAATINTGSGLLALSSGTSLATAGALASSTSISLTALGGTLGIGHNLTGGTVTLLAGDAISQSAGAITGSSLAAKTKKTGGAAITLAQVGNHLPSVSLLARNTGDLGDDAGAIKYVDSGAYDLAAAGVHSTSTVSLSAGGALTQTGTILASGLELLGAGPFTLNAANAASVIAGNVSGALAFTNNGTLSVGTVNSAGLTSTAGVTLTATGSTITQTKPIYTATSLSVTTAGGAALSQANTVSSFTATNTGSGDVTLINTIATLTVSSISNAGGGSISITNTGALTTTGAVAASTANGSASLTATGLLTIGGTVTSTGTGTVGLTGVGVTNNSTVTGTGGVSIDAGTGYFTNSPAHSVVNSGAAPIDITADNMTLSGSITGNSGAVTLKPKTATQLVNLGGADAAGTLGLTSAELQTITTSGLLTIGDPSDLGQVTISATINPTNPSGGMLIENKTGGIAIGASVTSAGALTLTANAGAAAAGAITWSAGTLTASTGNLSLNAATGIGSIVGSAPVTIAVPAGSFSATNTTSGDLYVRATGNVTVGVAAFGLTQYSGGALRVDSGGNITINGNVTVLGVGSIELEATGTITEASAGAGSLQANTVKLGLAGTTTSIGILAAPILSTATTLLSSQSSNGSIFLSNTGAVSVAAAAASGLVNIQNAGNMTVANTVSGTTGVTLSVSGAGNSFIHSAGTISASNAAIAITADDFNLSSGASTIAAGNGSISFAQTTNGRPVDLGTNAAGSLGLVAAELLEPSTTGTFTVGNSFTGTVTVSSAVSVSNAPTLAITSGAAVSGGGAIGAGSLAVSAASGIALSGASSVPSVQLSNSGSGNVGYTGSSVGGAATLTVTGSDAAAGGTFTVQETSGALTVGAAGLSTHGGTISLTTLKAAGLLTISGTVDSTAAGLSPAGGDLTLVADDMSIGGALRAGTGGAFYLYPNNVARTISLGAGSSGLGLSNAELGNLYGQTGLTIGRATQTGQIQADGAVDMLTPAHYSGPIFLITTTGGIALSTYAITTPGNLSLSSVGAVTGSGQLTIGASGASSLSATSSNGISLSNAGNLANAVSLTNGNASGNILFYDNRNMTLTATNSFAGGTIAVVNGAGTMGTSGAISTTGPGAADISLQTVGALTISNPITAADTGYISLSAGSTTQTAILTSGSAGLLLLGAGPYSLTQANAVGLVAASITGASNALSFTSAGALSVGTVNGTSGITTTAGAVTLNTGAGAISLNYAGGPVISSSGGQIQLQRPVTLAANATVSSGAGDVTFSQSVDADAAGNNRTLTVDSTGATLFSGPVGGNQALASLTTDAGGSMTAANVTTRGSQLYHDASAAFTGTAYSTNDNGAGGLFQVDGPLSLQASPTVTTGAGNATFLGTVDADLAANNRSLTVDSSGTTSFSSTVGGAQSLASLTTDAAGTTSISANVTTSNGQTYNDPVTLYANILFTANAAQTVHFANTLDGSGMARTVRIVAANAQFDGAVGAANVQSLVVDGTTALNASVTTSGLQTYTGAVTLGADLSTTSGTGAIGFSSTVGQTGTRTLTVQNAASTGNVTFGGAVTLTGLATGAGNYAVAFNNGGTITNAVAFTNTGGVTIAAGLTANAGLTSTTAGTNTFQGTVATDGIAGHDISVSNLTVGGSGLTLNAGLANFLFSAIVNVGNVVSGAPPDPVDDPTDLTITAALIDGSVSGTLQLAQDATADIGASNFNIKTLTNPGQDVITNATTKTITRHVGIIRLTGTQTIHTISSAGYSTAGGAFLYYGSGGTIFTSGIVDTSAAPGPYNYWDLIIDTTGIFTPETDIVVHGSVRIRNGALSAGSLPARQITVGGNWRNDVDAAGFTAGVESTSVVSFLALTSPVIVWGSNNWYIFKCTAPGVTFLFENDKTQSIATGGNFWVKSAGASITLSRLTPGTLPLPNPTNNPGTPPANPGDDPYFWFFDLKPGASFTMGNVNVFYSNARDDPISVPAGVTATPYSTHYCYKWLDIAYSIYSYTEDTDYNGKIDRIRVTTESNIDTSLVNLSGFQVEVQGYDIDASKGTNGYAVPVSGYAYYIYLKEKTYNDTGVTPDWHIIKNTTFRDAGGKLIGTLSRAGGSDWMTPGDTAWPFVGYTLALPGQTTAFVHLSESVVQTTWAPTTAPAAVDLGFSGGLSPITTSGVGIQEATGTAPTPPTVANIYNASNKLALTGTLRDMGHAPYWEPAYNGQVIGAPNPSYPPATGYAADPNSYALAAGQTDLDRYNANPFELRRGGAAVGYFAPNIQHRVSDLMVSLPPPATGAYDPLTYFAWPIYAKDQVALSLSDADIAALTPAQTAAEGIGLIRAFDGSQWLRPQNITLQTRVSASLGLTPTLVYDSGVAASYKGAYGVWLPFHLETSFSGIDGHPDLSTHSNGVPSPVAGGLWDFALASTDSKIQGAANGSAFDFFYQLSSAPGDLYVGRLDIPSGSSIPADWYRRVKPFSFGIHNVALQKGGATILNNVIDPTKGETARLSYQLASAGSVTVTVFTLDGDVVARLVNTSSQAAGDHAVSWNGRNLSGSAVARGLYFIRIVAPGMDEIRKVLVVRK